MAAQPKLTKDETEVLEMVRTLSHLPLSTIQAVFETFSTVIGLLYAHAMATTDTDDDVSLTVPYLGELKIKGDALVIDWSQHSLILKDLVNAKRAVSEQDTSLSDMWRARLEAELLEKL